MKNKKLTTSAVATLLLATCLYSNELSPITVTSATKSKQAIKDVSSDIDLITKDEIEEKHYTTITEALNSITGISFTSNGGLGKLSSVRLRGFDSKRVLVLIDGVRYNDFTSTSGAPFENIMMNDINRIEVIKGAQSGVWGADASAGVINIITNTYEEGLHASANLELGSFSTKKYGLNLSYATKKYYVKALFNIVNSDGFTAHAAKGENIKNYEDDAYTNKTYTFKTGYKFNDNNKIDLAYTLVKAENEFDNFGSDSLTNSSSTKNKLYSLNYENINSFASTNLYFNRSDFFRDYPPYSSKYEGKIDEVGIKTKIDYFNESSFFLLGADYKKFKQNDAVIKDYKNKALFFTNSNKFDKFILTQSLRYDRYDSFDNKLTGKIGTKYTFTDDLSTSINYGTAYNIPKLNELYGSFGANENLEPETTKSLDFSLAYKEFTFTYFYNTIEDMIEWNGGGYNNISGNSKIKGFELDYKKEVLEDTLLSLGYTRLKARDNEDRDLRRRAKQTLKFGLDYYGLEKLHLGLFGEYVGSRFDDSAKQKQTGKYTIANFVANYDLDSNMNVYVKIDNIFDKYYQTVDGYATAPRSLYLGLNYKF